MAAIRHYIDRGIRTFHLLHGESQYKRDLGGTSVRLASYVVLRNWASLSPVDVATLGRKHLLGMARRSIGRVDRVAQRVLDGRTPLTSLARWVAGRARKLGRA